MCLDPLATCDFDTLLNVITANGILWLPMIQLVLLLELRVVGGGCAPIVDNDIGDAFLLGDNRHR